MSPYCSNNRVQNKRTSRVLLKLSIAILSAVFTTAFSAAQDLTVGVTYVCSGERMFIENCNIRDLSDTAKCMVGHPDHVMPNGLIQYTYMTRGELKKLFPTCTQPSSKQVAAAQAFQQKQQDLYNANVQKANDQLNAATQPITYGQPQKPKTPEERATNRCVTSGRLPSSCVGNSLLGAFGQMLSSVLPGADKQPTPGPNMAGVFQGAGNWRLDFIDGGVLVNCSFLSPNQESYTIDFKNGRTVLTINTTPKPLVLTVRDDNTIVGPGPVTIDGVVPSGSGGGGSTPGHTETHQVTTTERINAYEAPAHYGDTLTNTGGGTYDATHTTTTSTYVPGTSTPTYTTFAHRRTTCPAINLSTKGASVGIQTMQTDLLKTMFGETKVHRRLPESACTVSSLHPPASASSSSLSPRSSAAAPMLPAPIPTPSRQMEPEPWSKSTRPIIRSLWPSDPMVRLMPAVPGPIRFTDVPSPARIIMTTSPSLLWR